MKAELSAAIAASPLLSVAVAAVIGYAIAALCLIIAVKAVDAAAESDGEDETDSK